MLTLDPVMTWSPFNLNAWSFQADMLTPSTKPSNVASSVTSKEPVTEQDNTAKQHENVT